MAFLTYYNIIVVPLLMLWPHFHDNSMLLMMSFWVLDFICLVEICLNFIKIRENSAITDPFDIALNYLKGTFFIDLACTMPQLFSFQDKRFWFLKMGRVIHLRYCSVPIEVLLSLIFASQPHRKKDLLYITAYFIHMMMLAHVFVTIWIWMGDKTFF